MSWQQLRNEAAANSRFEFSHDFPEHGAVRRLPIELAQPSNSFRHRSSKYEELSPPFSMQRTRSVIAIIRQPRAAATPAVATMETAY